MRDPRDGLEIIAFMLCRNDCRIADDVIARNQAGQGLRARPIVRIDRRVCGRGIFLKRGDSDPKGPIVLD